MKHIRNILLLITIIFAFVMQAEVYQNMLWNFNGAYYLSSRYTTTNDDMDSFLANAEDTAEKHGVHIFSTFNQRVSNYQTRLYIYGDGTVVRDSLKSTMDIEEKTYTKWFDYDKIKNSPCARTRRQGDYLTVNSEGGRKKLNRIFIDEKIPAEMRDRLPVVAVGSEILWIPGGRMNEKYKITSTTGRVLELHYQGGALA